MADPQPNYDYSGIGKAEALLVYSALAASSVSWLTNGLLGKATFWALEQICTWLANKEVMVLNIAATDIQTVIQAGEFDATFDDAFKAINKSKDPLTAAQKAAIDQPVIDAFRKFAVFGQLRASSDTRVETRNNTPS